MSTLLSGPSVMSETQQPAEDPVGTGTIRLDAELIRMARIICAHSPGRGARQMKLVDYLDTLLRGSITADYNRIMASIAEGQKKEKKPKG